MRKGYSTLIVKKYIESEIRLCNLKLGGSGSEIQSVS